ncbi:MAG: hypothetical protein WC807_10705 [Hyphomicrobium sp.]|jgi:hypothetical protein
MRLVVCAFLRAGLTPDDVPATAAAEARDPEKIVDEALPDAIVRDAAPTLSPPRHLI